MSQHSSKNLISLQPLPLVSALMTVFNAEKYLSASIESILDQTFSNWEFIIVDDASTDRSLEIMEAYAAKDRRIRLICNECNKGQTLCLNQGLKEARGRWVARQDADDLSDPTRLEKQLARVTGEPSLALLGTSGFIIDEHDRRTGLLDLPLTEELIRWSAPILNPFLHTSVLFQTEVACTLGGYDTQYRIAQDYDLWTRMMAEHCVANLPERLVSYRHLESSLSKVGRSTAFEEAQAISEREEQKAFGRQLNVEERELFAEFRSGLSLSKRKQFWKLYNVLQSSLQSSKRKDSSVLFDAKRLCASYHLKIAGSARSSSASLLSMMAEIGTALCVDPKFTVKWFWERYGR
ncbi:MAG: hypothetical protein A3F67_09700 [Verrucomicrobia bacterium RIFCSPHIGHO2_12_FULL_41_10]|nr:MAG: hypothetical protein A3F67_09700 [Verrucomicrobia bacterium RIFCSPHIGHO2_12_FULL_41_10]HLB33039.1 glycosyltransferase [Chthoniobacterales bacterium]